MKLTAIPRITLGLVSLSVALFLVFDLLLHLFPSEADTAREVRTQVGNNLALQTAVLVQSRDLKAVERTLQSLQDRDPEIVSLGLRRADGALLAQAGDHAQHWVAPPGGGNSLNAMAVGIFSEGRRWGALEIAFRPIHRRSLGAWLFAGPTKLVLLFSVLASVMFFVYLRRSLQYLDPSAAVPDHVRAAFDSLSEGVLIIDPAQRVLLANRAFQLLSPPSEGEALIGKKASELAWLRPAAAEVGADAAPWATVMSTRMPVHGQSFEIMRGDAVSAQVVLNCTPLLNERRGVRGCLVTIDDVTALELSHKQLLDVLADLADSKEQLERKNAELQDLSSRDALSGCLNRRAFFAGFERLYKQALDNGTELICIMADIDHFKSINDRFGHAAGDEAIQRFAKTLNASVRPGDLVGRYGGEEFCVVSAGMSMERAMELAETMRQRVCVERRAAPGAAAPVSISASFGVTSMLQGARSATELVDQADRAMYVAKKSGRNRVVAFSLEATLEPAAVPLAE